MKIMRLLFFVAVIGCAAGALADELPPGVPRVIGTSGETIFVPMRFTTDAYNKAALGWMLQEANDVARRMKLGEDLPITKSNLYQCVVFPFGFSYERKKVGTITTSNYWYSFTRSNKISEVMVRDVDDACRRYRRGLLLPISELDTNSPYQVASQWLASASIDVAELDRDCSLRVEPNHFWNGVGPDQQFNVTNFVPIYDVFWISRDPSMEGRDSVWVEYYSPDEKLMAMCIYDAKYILRRPFQITNLADVFPGKARIFTNTGQLKVLPKGTLR